MKDFSIDYLLTEINETIKAPDQNSMRLAAITGIRQVFRKIGIQLVCAFKEDEPIIIQDGYYRIPAKVMLIDDIYDAPKKFGGDPNGYKITSGIHLRKKLAYRETPLELQFPNMRKGFAYMAYFSMYEDEDGDLIIPEVVYNACFQFCEHKLLNNTNNPKNPKWSERRIMKADADTAIFDARGELNKTTVPILRTARILQ